MGLFSKFSYLSKAKAIAKKHSLVYELLEMSVEDINKKALEERENPQLFADLLLYNFYKNTCAYTANNVMALYVDVFRGLKVEVPDYEFFVSVGKFLEQASAIEDVFDSKEYYLNLANYELISDKNDVQKAFDVLVGMKPEYIDSDSQYMTGCLYYMLDMLDMSKKVLEVNLSDMNEEQKASSNCILAMIYQKEGNIDEAIHYAKEGMKSRVPAVVTASSRLLNQYERYDLVVDAIDEEVFSSVKNVRLFYQWIYALKRSGKSIDVCPDIVEEDELYEGIKETVNGGEEVDVDQFIKDFNQQTMDEIASSELYEYADDTTKRMLNNRIMSLSTNADDFMMRDYVVFSAFYVD